jgi:curved DNA-binding protein CbpA
VTVRIPTLVRKPHSALELDPDASALIPHIDGVRGPMELAQTCSLSIERVAHALVRLADLGLVDLGGSPRAERAVLLDPQDADIELDEAQRANINATYDALDGKTLYQILGLERSAERKSVKRAYYEKAAAVHPDRHFRKRLGSYKAKMEHVFARLTEAHDVLSDRDRRKEYDDYLKTVSATDTLEGAFTDDASLARENVAQQELARLQAEAEEQVREAMAQITSAAIVSIPAPMVSLPPVVASTEAARKAVLAQKLLAGRRSSAATAPIKIASSPKLPTSADAVETLRRRYEEAFVKKKAGRVAEQVRLAEQAQAAGDVPGAVSAYQIALSLSPHDPALKTALMELQTKATIALHAQYCKQADYEERNGKIEEALRNWKKAVQTQPTDPEANARTALALLKARGDLHQAAEFAKRAIELSPRDATFYVALAKVYAEARLLPAARTSVETALALDSTLAEALALRRRLLEGAAP